MDLIVGSSDGKIFYYLNTGSKKKAIFTAQTGSANPFNHVVASNASPFLADLNTDGLMDLIVGKRYNVLYFANTGTITNPVFTESRFLDIPNPFESIKADVLNGFEIEKCYPSLVDLNSDSKLDLILGNGPGKIQYYINTGTLPIHSAFTCIGQNNLNILSKILIKKFTFPPLFLFVSIHLPIYRHLYQSSFY